MLAIAALDLLPLLERRTLEAFTKSVYITFVFLYLGWMCGFMDTVNTSLNIHPFFVNLSRASFRLADIRQCPVRSHSVILLDNSLDVLGRTLQLDI